MKILIDACVLYPTVMREIVIGVANAGLFEPFWSARILEEWACAVARMGPVQEQIARGEIARLRSHWPRAELVANPTLEAQLYLPDMADCHVLASAISGQADVLMTMNLKDFPNRSLTEFGFPARHPDAILRDLFDLAPTKISAVGERVRHEAEKLSGEPQTIRKLMKKARLPRLGKALELAS